MRRPAGLALAAAWAGAALLPACAAEPAADKRAEAVFERTKTTRATYALYSWNWVREAGGKATPRWSAEFHRGKLHRVETPHIRIVADCEAMQGTMLDVAAGRTESRPAIARAACGINSNVELLRLEWLGRRESRFGPVDALRILDPAEERLYVVDEAGILVAAEIFPRDPAGDYCVQQEPLAVERRLPAGDMFSAASLRKSFAADRFRRVPTASSGEFWRGTRRCT